MENCAVNLLLRNTLPKDTRLSEESGVFEVHFSAEAELPLIETLGDINWPTFGLDSSSHAEKGHGESGTTHGTAVHSSTDYN